MQYFCLVLRLNADKMVESKILLNALKLYEIEVKAIEGNRVKVHNNFEIGIQANALFNLTNNGDEIAAFVDVDELCGFIMP